MQRTTATRARRARWGAAGSVAERRNEILRELGAAVVERGFGALTMKDVADRLGLVKGNLYYYFKNKKELLYHWHIKCMEVSLRALEEVQRSRASPTERLRTLLVRHIRAITEDGYGAVLLTDLESLTPAQRRQYVALRDRFEHGVRTLIREGVARGELRAHDPRIAGFALLGAINWIPKWYRPEGELGSEEIAEQFADILLHGIKA